MAAKTYMQRLAELRLDRDLISELLDRLSHHKEFSLVKRASSKLVEIEREIAKIETKYFTIKQ